MKNKTLIALLLSIMATGCNAKSSDFHVGEITGAEIIKEFKSFAKHKNDISYSNADLAPLRAIATPIEVKVFFGEWCHDSVREVPRLISLFEQVNNKNIKPTFYGLDTAKSDPKDEALKHSIKKTPTVIVYKGGIELGRFLEFPKTDWANDIATLVLQAEG
ncbi:thioredoxin family protein [Psychrosphaera sp.]|nr:thioredoxin family protein [Psychrosphaera sp.]